jgi:hypothetical protein
MVGSGLELDRGSATGLADHPGRSGSASAGDVSTIANVYAHLTPAMVQRSADRMDSILRKRPAIG